MSRFAFLLVLFGSSVALAAPYELTFRNPSATQAYTSLRTPWGVVSAPCGPGATCKVVLDVPPGYQTVTATATDGQLWSLASNALKPFILPTPAECAAIQYCKADLDADGVVTGADFAIWLESFGKSWAIAPTP